MKKIDVSLILPCFNEHEVFEGSVAHIASVLSSSKYAYEIIFVDDMSVDNTKSLIKNTKYKAIFHTKNMGRGAAVRSGIKAARGKVVGYIDIDCEVSPVYIPAMVEMILEKKADVVIGRRQYRTSFGSVIREILSRGYMWLAHVLLETEGLDTESGYKFFNREKIVPVLDRVEHQGWFWDTEIIVRSKRAGLRIAEMPVLFLRRFDKTSSVHIVPDTIEYMKNLWRIRKTL